MDFRKNDNNRFLVKMPVLIVGLALTMGAARAEAAVVIANSTRQEQAPAVAYNEDDHEYLVVWSRDFSASDRDLVARRTDSDGAPIGSAFSIASTSKDEILPGVAYNTDDREFLVVYERESAAGNVDVHGQRISRTGSLLGSSFPVASTTSNEQAPRVVYHSHLRKYVVTWEFEWSWPDFDVRATAISATGQLGNLVTIASSGAPEHAPDLDCRSTTPECLFVWQEFTTTSSVVAHAVDMETGQGSGSFDVTAGNKDDMVPRVSHGMGNEYLIVWQHAYSTSDWDVHAQRATGTNTVGSVIKISQQTVNEMFPDVCYLEGRGRYLVAWERYDGSSVVLPRVDIRARHVSYYGTLEVVRFLGSLSTDDQRPSVAGSPTFSFGALVVWEHLFSPGDWDVHGEVVFPGI